ncbi:hypothetical protein QVD17_39694 [Tagetes erecta]|uniref:Uncharacterized protein n=1 Tax=Tagetes erecta TaxID=13708 RepID=A0AAD8NGH9_TARER|nr:hypothetical protein QVD17_39694 [Tagetes erecta]
MQPIACQLYLPNTSSAFSLFRSLVPEDGDGETTIVLKRPLFYTDMIHMASLISYLHHSHQRVELFFSPTKEER